MTTHDIFTLAKKLKSKSLVVQPGRASIPHTADAFMRTGLDSGACIVKLSVYPAKGSEFDGLDDEGNILIREPDGLVRPFCTEPLDDAPDMIVMPADAVPATIPGKKLWDWLDAAASDAEHRPALQGVFVHEDGTRLTTTDGHRLHDAKLSKPLAENMPKIVFPSEFSFVLQAAKRWHVTERSSYLDLDGMIVRVPHLDADSYPTVDAVIPTKRIHVERIDSKTLAKLADEAQKAVRKIGDKNTAAVFQRSDDGKFSLWAKAHGGEWRSAHIPTHVTEGEGHAPTVGVNPCYLKEALKNADGASAIALQSSTDPLLVGLPPLDGAEKRRAIVMPMRL